MFTTIVLPEKHLGNAVTFQHLQAASHVKPVTQHKWSSWFSYKRQGPNSPQFMFVCTRLIVVVCVQIAIISDQSSTDFLAQLDWKQLWQVIGERGGDTSGGWGTKKLWIKAGRMRDKHRTDLRTVMTTYCPLNWYELWWLTSPPATHKTRVTRRWHIPPQPWQNLTIY